MTLAIALARPALDPTIAFAQADTTFAVPTSGTISIDGHTGAVRVSAWDRSDARIQLSTGDLSAFALRLEAGGLVLSARPPQSPSARALVVTVPRAYAVQVRGAQDDVRVEGVDGAVDIAAAQGDIEVVGGTGAVTATTLRGAILVEDRRGDATVRTLDRSIHLIGVQGVIEAAATNGGVQLTGVESDAVEATSLNGGIEFEGQLRAGGRYHLSTHNGTITLVLPEDAGVTIQAIALVGRLDAAFPIQLVRSGPAGRYTLVQGDGSARVDLESFTGDIRLRRPNELPPASGAEGRRP